MAISGVFLMQFNYAQISINQKVEAISELHSAVIAPNLIELDENKAHQGRAVQLGDLWTGAAFVEQGAMQ
jgi:hypothetical protein